MAAKKVLIFGGTGKTGQLVVTQAVEKGYDVTAFVRNADHLPANSRIRVIIGQVAIDARAVANAVRGQDVVISTLGRGLSLKANGLIDRCAQTIVAALEQEGVRRLIFTSAFGVGDSFRDATILPRLIFRTALRSIYADKELGEAHIQKSTLDWTLVRPSVMNDEARTGHYRADEHLEVKGFQKISRADAADFIVSQIDATNFIRKVATISY